MSGGARRLEVHLGRLYSFLNIHFEPQIHHSGVANLANSPAISYDSHLAVANLDIQFAAPSAQ